MAMSNQEIVQQLWKSVMYYVMMGLHTKIM